MKTMSHRLITVGLCSLVFCTPSAEATAAQSGGVVEQIMQWTEPWPNMAYGTDVCFIGDYDQDGVKDIAVGAAGADANGLPSSGSVFLYSGRTFALIGKIDGQEAHANLGESIANAGDTDGDGVDDILLGMRPLNMYAGGASLYSGATLQLLHFYPGSSAYDSYGAAVSSAGDVDADGLSDIIIGAPRETGKTGKAYVYSGATNTLLYTLIPVGRTEDFGTSVTTAGDTNLDGYDDFAVGASTSWENGVKRCGSVYIYSGRTGNLLYQLDGTVEKGKFGESIAYGGDVNRDGYPDLIVGAPEEDFIRPDTGTVYVFSGRDGSILHSFIGPKNRMELGSKVSYAGDLDGDGFDDVLASAGGYNIYEDGEWIRGVFAMSGRTGEVLIGNGGRYASKFVGLSVSGGTDLDGDGRSEVLCSSSRANWAGGMAFLQSYYPGLKASANSISASLGGRLDFHLAFPISTAGAHYTLLASASGSGPRKYLGMPIPLDFDALTSAILYKPPSLFSNSQGMLDSNGRGHAWLVAAPNELSPFSGQTIWFAAISSRRFFGDSHSSVAVPITVTP